MGFRVKLNYYVFQTPNLCLVNPITFIPFLIIDFVITTDISHQVRIFHALATNGASTGAPTPYYFGVVDVAVFSLTIPATNILFPQQQPPTFVCLLHVYFVYTIKLLSLKMHYYKLRPSVFYPQTQLPNPVHHNIPPPFPNPIGFSRPRSAKWARPSSRVREFCP